jgi:hypothetical protein
MVMDAAGSCHKCTGQAHQQEIAQIIAAPAGLMARYLQDDGGFDHEPVLVLALVKCTCCAHTSVQGLSHSDHFRRVEETSNFHDYTHASDGNSNES